ncbi:MAG: hypothetical protein ACRYHQ_20530 [Janthinobacterium lividum]
MGFLILIARFFMALMFMGAAHSTNDGTWLGNPKALIVCLVLIALWNPRATADRWFWLRDRVGL